MLLLGIENPLDFFRSAVAALRTEVAESWLDISGVVLSWEYLGFSYLGYNNLSVALRDGRSE